jgi:hypothetical protein
MKISLMSIMLLTVLCTSTPVVADVPNLGLAMQIVEARQKNAALMKQYSWESRTELIENGVVKDIRIEQVTYGPGGQVQRALINDQPAALPGGFFRKKIAEKDREKTEDYLKGLRTLLDQYTITSAGKMIDFISQATLQPPDMNGLVQVTGGSVVMPGDTISLWINPLTRTAQRMKVMTFYEGSEVNVSITFKTLATGLTYPAYSQVDVFGMGLSLQVQNFNYMNQNQ